MPARSQYAAQLSSAGMPTQNVTGLDATQAEIERKRRMAELLQSQSFKGLQLASPNAPASILNAIAPMLQAYMGKREAEGLGKQEQELAAQRSENLSRLLSEMPQGQTISGTPAIAPQEAMPERQGMPAQAQQVPPPAPPSPFGAQAAGVSPMAQLLAEGTPPGMGGPPPLQSLDELTKPAGSQSPMLPAKPAMLGQQATPDKMVPADPREMMQWAANLAAQGGPVGQRIGEQFTSAAVKNLVPDQERQAQLEADRELRALTAAQTHESRMTEIKRRGEEAQVRSQDTRLSIEQRREAAAESTAARREIASLVAATKAEGGGATTDVGYSPEGNAVVRNKQGVRFEIDPTTGRPKTEPFAGDVMPATAREKEIAKTQEAAAHLNEVSTLLASVEKDSSMFGTPKALGSSLPVVGPYVAEKALTAEQKQARAAFAQQGAEYTKKLYGAAFSAGEQLRADPFIVKPTDPPEVVFSKMKNMKEHAERALAAKSVGARKAAAARAGGEKKNITVEY